MGLLLPGLQGWVALLSGLQRRSAQRECCGGGARTDSLACVRSLIWGLSHAVMSKG